MYSFAHCLYTTLYHASLYYAEESSSIEGTVLLLRLADLFSRSA